MNEATIWSRAIYPVLLMAESRSVQAWVQVSLTAIFSDIKLTGVADGILARVIAGVMRAPYLVTLETKRSIEAKNPRIQFYGQLLAAAKLNWLNREDPNAGETQEIFGCYTVGDVWTFARATVQGLATDDQKPFMHVQTSREFSSRMEAETILKILKKIISLYERQE